MKLPAEHWLILRLKRFLWPQCRFCAVLRLAFVGLAGIGTYAYMHRTPPPIVEVGEIVPSTIQQQETPKEITTVHLSPEE